MREQARSEQGGVVRKRVCERPPRLHRERIVHFVSALDFTVGGVLVVVGGVEGGKRAKGTYMRNGFQIARICSAVT